MHQRMTATTLSLAGLLACTHAPPPAVPAPPAAAVTPSQPVTPAAPIPALPDTAADPTVVFDGWKLFHIHCFRCHGFDAEGGGAPNLRETVKHRLTRQGFIVTVLGGRPDRGMPTWGEVLNAEQAAAIYTYVVERATERLPPGRPQSPE